MFLWVSSASKRNIICCYAMAKGGGDRGGGGKAWRGAVEEYMHWGQPPSVAPVRGDVRSVWPVKACQKA